MKTQNINTIFSLVALFTCSALIILFLRQNLRSKVAKSFVFLMVSPIVYEFFLILTYYAPSARMASVWLRLGAIGIILSPIGFFQFISDLLPKLPERIINWHWRVFLPLAAIFILLLPTDLLLDGVVRAHGAYWITNGPLFPVLAFYFIVTFGGSTLSFLLRYFNLRDDKLRRPVGLPLISSIIVYGAASIQTLPAAFGVYSLAGLNIRIFLDGSLILMAILVTYDIIQFGTFSFSRQIKERIAISLLTTLFADCLLVLGIVVSDFLDDSYSLTLPVILIAASLIMLIVFEPTQNWVWSFVNRVLYRERQEFFDQIKTFASEIAMAKGLLELYQGILRSFQNSLGVSSVSLFLKDAQTKQFRMVASVGLGPKILGGLIFSSDHGIVEIIGHRRAATEKEMLGHSPLEEDARQNLAQLHARVAVPLLTKEELTGILFLGAKNSGEKFSDDDIELCNMLAHQATIALYYCALSEIQSLEVIQQYYNSFLQDVPMGLVLMDNSGRVIVFSQFASRISGLLSEQVIGKKLADLRNIADEPVYSLLSILTAALTRKKTFSRKEVSLLKKNGETIDIGYTLSLLQDNKKQLIGSALVFQDLTEIKAIEKELLEKQRLSMLGQLVTHVAHDIRNPLNVIRMFTELLDLELNPESKENTKIILEQIQLCDTRLENLLGFARPSFKHAPLKKININQFLRDLLPGITRLREENIELKPSYFDKSLPVLASPDDLNRIFTNLVDNACAAMPEGGTLTIATGREKDYAVFKVADSGQGLEPEIMEHIFEPFFTTKEFGTGLGLAIVRSIIFELNGSIEAKSHLDRGTSFTVKLPLATKTREARGSPKRKKDRDQNRIKQRERDKIDAGDKGFTRR